MKKYAILILYLLFIIAMGVAMVTVGVWVYNISQNIYLAMLPVAVGVLIIFVADILANREKK